MPNPFPSVADLARLRNLAAKVHKFGWQAAKTKSGGVKAVGTGPDATKKPLYGAKATAALGRGAKAPQATQPTDAEASHFHAKQNYEKASAEWEKARKAHAAGQLSTQQKNVAGQRIEDATRHLADAAKRSGKPLPTELQPPGKPVAKSAPAPQATAAPQQAPNGSDLLLPEPKAGIAPSGPAGATYRVTPKGTRVKLGPKPSERAAAEKAAAAKAAQQPPAPTPAEAKVIDDHHASDVKTFGQRAADVLKKALSAALGFLTFGVGAAVGAAGGFAVGGPLGLAAGTSLGGGIGARMGLWAGNKTHDVLSRTKHSEAAQFAELRCLAAKFADAAAPPPPVDASPESDPVALIKKRLAQLAAARGVPMPDVPDDQIQALLAKFAAGESEQPMYDKTPFSALPRGGSKLLPWA